MVNWKSDLVCNMEASAESQTLPVSTVSALAPQNLFWYPVGLISNIFFTITVQILVCSLAYFYRQ